jgi:tetratricopeptide (TPR) repeat protein
MGRGSTSAAVPRPAPALRYSAAMHRTPPAVAAVLAAVTLLAPGPASAAACSPGTADASLQSAGQALAAGEWPVAADAYACAALASPDPVVAARATRVAHEHAQLRAAERAARRWLALEPGREEPRRFLAITLLRLYREDEAASQFRVLLESAYAERSQGYAALLEVLASERNDTGAARVMETLASGDDGVAEAHYARSVLWQQADDGARALEAARRALQLKPAWRMAELAEVRALLLLGREDEAFEAAASLAADGDPLTRLNQAWLLLGAGREDEARAAFESLLREDVARQQALEGLGSVAYAQRDFAAATRHFAELSQSSRGDETALALLGLIAEEQGEPALAVRYLERVATGPRAVSSQLRAYRLTTGLGLPERAELALADFLEQSPGSARDLATGRATQLAEDGRGNEAVALMERALELYPDDDDLRLSMAFVLERLDRVDAAVRVMRDVLERRPADPTALNSLGYTLLDRTRSVKEGYELVRRAAGYKPDNYAIMDSMGWGLHRLGRQEEALVWLQRAWDRSRDPEVAAHLGEVLWESGRREEARALWQLAKDRAPDNRSLRRVLERYPD